MDPIGEDCGVVSAVMPGGFLCIALAQFSADTALILTWAVTSAMVHEDLAIRSRQRSILTNPPFHTSFIEEVDSQGLYHK